MIFLLYLKLQALPYGFLYIHIQNQFSAVISRQLLGLKDNIYITETKRSQFHFLPLPKVTTKGKMKFAFKLVPFYTI